MHDQNSFTLRLKIVRRLEELEKAIKSKPALPDKTVEFDKMCDELERGLNSQILLSLLPKNKYGSVAENGKQKLGIDQSTWPYFIRAIAL